MGMATQQDIEPAVEACRYTSGICEPGWKTHHGDRCSSPLGVLHSVEMGITDAAGIDALGDALNNGAIVDNILIPIAFGPAHANHVVIAEHAVDRAFEGFHRAIPASVVSYGPLVPPR